jgi:hypothetical protein
MPKLHDWTVLLPSSPPPLRNSTLSLNRLAHVTIHLELQKVSALVRLPPNAYELTVLALSARLILERSCCKYGESHETSV